MKKVCFLAQFPPPIHGLSKAVETLYCGLAGDFEAEKVNLTNNKAILHSLWTALRSDADLFYLTISQTRGGNLRDLLFMNLLHLRGKKCVVHLHGGYYRELVEQGMPAWQRAWNYRAVGRLAGAIVLSESLKQIFIGMLPEEKIFAVPNSVEDECLIGDEAFEEKLAAAEHKEVKHVLYLSNFFRAKGFPEVLELARLEKERCDAGGPRLLHFDFAGRFYEKTEEDYFFGFIKEHYLEQYITYHGIAVGAQKKELLAQSDYFMLLSQNEGQPISILEAMGNGLIVFTTNAGGIPDIVEDGVNGYLSDKKNLDVNRIYEKIINPGSCRAMMLCNRRAVKEHYRQECYLAGMKKVFRDLTE